MKKVERLARAAAARALLFGDDAPPPIDDRKEPDVPAKQDEKQAAKPAARRGKVAKQAADAAAQEEVDPFAPDPYAVWKQPIGERHWPKHEHGALKRGDSVWYRGERFWVEFANDHWSKGVYVRISDRAVHPDPTRPLPSDDGKCLTFCVHAGCLTLAPVVKNVYAKQPTMAGVERAERAKAGIRDVGDDVATMLRDAKTLEDVYKIGGKYLDETVADLHKKYGHLNHGQQRMVIGNRMRAKWKKEQK